APLPALVAAADVTSRLRIGSFVFDNDYRNPVMLAKEAATVDLLSDGRLELGLGAGWNTRDYAQLGIAYDPPKMRVDRFAEALARLRAGAGGRRERIALNVIVFGARVTDLRRSLAESVSAWLGAAVTAVLRTPFFLYGSRRSIVEDLLERRERLGISYIALPERAMRSFAPIVAELRGK